ncbi:hypothetical protein V5O48_012263 [Marasmius crinis-equi]|uniref:ZZ-type domain-containing protein n=1 Tax=Marasmius crinis-equi TaxID=585013 RepID=A0ABR3F3V3_9AGAR
MAPGPLTDSIGEARKAVERSVRSYNVSKGQKALNAIEDKFLDASNSKHVALAEDASGNIDFSVIKEQVSNFAEDCKFLMIVLDEIGKVHPFIQAAVAVFRAGVQLELTRRENDDRVLALYATMRDMMSVLTILDKIPSPKELRSGMSVEERLHGRMKDLVQSIKDCAKLCDSYQRKHAAIKFFTCFKWQSKFTDVAGQFVDHQNAIQSCLQLYIASEIVTVSSMVSTLNQNVAIMMEMVFERMQPAKDREIAELVQGKGGSQEHPNDQLIQDVIKYVKQLQQKDEKGNADPKGGPQRPTGMPADVNAFREELKKDVDTILRQNADLFEKKFEAVELSLKEVKRTINRESDRVIEKILSSVYQGPQRILDKDVYYVWREMGWKGRVKATDFVMALHDHMLAKSRDALDGIHAIANKPDQMPAVEKSDDCASAIEEALPAIPAEDRWLLQHIRLRLVQPLIEALDDDGSSYITVNEVNAFTNSRPEGWSLPRWIAYWTIGFRMTTHWYYRRICRLLSLIIQSSKRELPANRRVVSEFLCASPITILQHHLSGYERSHLRNSIDWGNHTFSKFKNWVDDTEQKMEEILSKLVYNIDQDNTLNTVTGGGRPEKVSVSFRNHRFWTYKYFEFMMPIFYLLLKRSFSIMEKAHDIALNKGEFQILLTSFFIVQQAVRERVEKLQDIYALQSIKTEEKLSSIFFGLYVKYTYTFDEPKKGEFWTRNVDSYNNMPGDPTSESVTKAERGLYYEQISQEADLDRIDMTRSPPSSSVESAKDAQSLTGVWSGHYASRSWQRSSGPFILSIARHASDNRFHCSGVDMSGLFSVDGRLNGDQVLFLKTYQQPYEAKQGISRRYQGALNEGQTIISGTWGYRLHNKEEESLVDGGKSHEHGDVVQVSTMTPIDPSIPTIAIEPPSAVSDGEENLTTNDDTVPEEGSAHRWVAEGNFVMNRRPAESRPRAHWALVRNAVSHHISWESIQERRDKRKAYLKGWERYQRGHGRRQWEKLAESVRPDDIYLWHCIAQFKYQREPIHSHVYCDQCQETAPRSTRVLCIECSRGEIPNTVDLCAGCFDKESQGTYNSKVHKATHPVLQLRWPLLGIEVHPVIEKAMFLLQQTLSDSEVKGCCRCSKDLEERPYWRCVDCKDAVFICIDCNKLDEKEKLWLNERKPRVEDVHHWMHTLALHPKETQTTPDEPLLSTDQRLAKMEARLQTMEDSVAARLKSMEEILQKIMLGTIDASPAIQ